MEFYNLSFKSAKWDVRGNTSKIAMITSHFKIENKCF